MDIFNDYSNLLLRNDLHDEINYIEFIKVMKKKILIQITMIYKETVTIRNKIKTIKNHKSKYL